MVTDDSRIRMEGVLPGITDREVIRIHSKRKLQSKSKRTTICID